MPKAQGSGSQAALALAATKADWFAFPPDFDWKKHKNVNDYHGVHVLGKRAKKSPTDGTTSLTIRFEMPFPIWCGGCGKSIAKGVRFNADKQETGTMYHSTKIYAFTLRTACCQVITPTTPTPTPTPTTTTTPTSPVTHTLTFTLR